MGVHSVSPSNPSSARSIPRRHRRTSLAARREHLQAIGIGNSAAEDTYYTPVCILRMTVSYVFIGLSTRIIPKMPKFSTKAALNEGEGVLLAEGQ